MILPGTLVQYVRNNPRSVLRQNGVYVVQKSFLEDFWVYCIHCNKRDLVVVYLCGVNNEHHGGNRPGWCSCAFRILAPPITEADRLEMSAPDNDGAKQPAKRKETV